MNNRTIYLTIYGSHLYGTHLTTSDMDYVSLMVPKFNDLLLQKASNFASTHTITAGGKDMTVHALPKFIKDLTEGNATALEILFSMKNTLAPLPRRIWLNRHIFLTKQSRSMIGYCRSQARKYDNRGEKFTHITEMLALIDQKIYVGDGNEKIINMNGLIKKLTAMSNVSVENIKQTDGTVIPHLVIYHKKCPWTFTVNQLKGMLEQTKEMYGKRTAEAASSKGVDWKGMMHSLRIAEQAVEYFETGHMTFPRPNAAYLKMVRMGLIPYADVSDAIDKMLIKVEEAAEKCTLTEKVDQDTVDTFLLQIYNELRGWDND